MTRTASHNTSATATGVTTPTTPNQDNVLIYGNAHNHEQLITNSTSSYSKSLNQHHQSQPQQQYVRRNSISSSNEFIFGNT